MFYQCTFCDKHSNSRDDPIFDECKKLRHQVVAMLAPKEVKSQTPEEEEAKHLEYAIGILHGHPIKTLKDTGEILVYDKGVYRNDPMNHTIKSYIMEIDKKTTIHENNEIIEKIKQLTYINRDEFDKDDFEVCVENGIINIRTGQFQEHIPSRLFMSKIPVTYKPGIIPLKFIKFMQQCLPIPNDYIDQMEAFASGLLKNSPKLETLFFSTGLADNGKSTFFKMINWFYGKDNVSNIAIHDLMQDRFARINLDKKRVNTFPDVESDELDNFAILKPLISGDEVWARDMYQKYRRLVVHAKMFFSANELPTISESKQTKSVLKRLRITEWTQTFLKTDAYNQAKEDLILDEKELIGEERLTNEEIEKELARNGKYLMNKQFIKEILEDENEKSGILNLLLITIRHLIRRDGFFIEYPYEATQEKWSKHSTAIQAFVNECLVKDGQFFLIKSQIYRLYYQYCKSIGKPVQSEKVFHESLKNLIPGLEEHKKRIRKGEDVTRVYFGLKWNVSHSLIKKFIGRMITEADEAGKFKHFNSYGKINSVEGLFKTPASVASLDE